MDTRWLADLAASGVAVRTQDIAAVAPGDGVFDLVHARYVLANVRGWQTAVEHLGAGVRPGGWILLEEGDMGPPFGRTAPEEPALGRVVEGLRLMMEQAGGDPDFGRRLPIVIRKLGLTDVGTHVRLWHAGSAALMLRNLETVGEAIVALGVMKPSELDRARAFLQDPANVIYGPICVSAWGRKPD
jgi:hypothetical protein